MIFNKRKFELLYHHQNFSKVDAEIAAHADDFSVAGDEARDFRARFAGSPFKDSPSIPCRLTYDFETEPTEEVLIEHLKTVGCVSTDAFDAEIYEDFPHVYGLVMWLAAQMFVEQVGRVLIARLMPGGHIIEHPDFGTYFEHYDRFHIVTGGKGCYFKCGRETVKMLPGEVWWFYNNDPHEVWNDSDTPRDHIVVDLKLRGDKMKLRTGGENPAIH